MTLLSLSLRRRFTSDVATRFSIWLVGVVLGVVRSGLYCDLCGSC